MFILEATVSYNTCSTLYYSYFGEYTEITLDKKEALKMDNIFDVKQLINKHNLKNYKIVEIKNS